MTKYDQDCILLEWCRYACTAYIDSTHLHWYLLPCDGIDMEVRADLSQIWKHQWCTKGMQKVMGIVIGSSRLKFIQTAALTITNRIMPPHTKKGTAGRNAIRDDDVRVPVLKEHFEMMMGLGEVSATQVVAAFEDGVQVGHTRCDDMADMLYAQYQ